MGELWDDEGPVSQGKILTAILKDDEGTAERLLQGWSLADLQILARAADRLGVLATCAAARRR